MRSYKANNKNELYYIFVYVAVLIAGVAFTKKPITALYMGGIFIPLAMIYILFYTRLTEIQVNSPLFLAVIYERKRSWFLRLPTLNGPINGATRLNRMIRKRFVFFMIRVKKY
jgi:hypothetical protein